MSDTKIIIPARQLKQLREDAKKLKKELGIPLHEAQDTVARKMHFANWPHLMEGVKFTAPSEEAYRSGLIIGMDISDALDHIPKDGVLVEDQLASIFIESDFKKSRGELTVDDNDFIEKIRDEILYFRYTKTTPKTLDEALEIAGNYFFFDPLYIWMKGEWLTPWGKFDYEKEWLEDGF